MVPFMPYFLGQETPPWPRATSVQKCVRTLDIDEVGKTTRHGTFFQMNGNFSFGDYFKEGAIELRLGAAHRLAGRRRLRPRPGDGSGSPSTWTTTRPTRSGARSTGLPAERIQRRGMDDNYWSMGVPGPAARAREIYYDRGPEYGAEGGPVVDEDRYLEIWNLVFMQDERGAGPGQGRLRRSSATLPAKNIDTGMGLERVASLLQGVDNLYEIDEVYPVLERAAELAGKRYGASPGTAPTSHPDDVRLRVVADHVRSALMLIGDGVTPGNEGRGYVLRRLMRRAVRSMRLLGVDEPGACPSCCRSAGPDGGVVPGAASDFGRISQIALRRGGGVPAHPQRRARRSSTRAVARGEVVRRADACRATRRSSCTTPTASRST